MSDREASAGPGSPPTPGDRAEKIVLEFTYGGPRHRQELGDAISSAIQAAVDADRDSHRAECQKLLDAANAAWDRVGEIAQKAVAEEREAIAAHFDECHRLDPSEWFPPASVAEVVRARGRC